MSNSSETQTQISNFSTKESVDNLSDDFLPIASLEPIRDHACREYAYG
jgi:hypothetical protein